MRTLNNVHYAPGSDAEFVKQAVSSQVTDHRAKTVLHRPHTRSPLLGKDDATTGALQRHVAASVIQNKFRERKMLGEIKSTYGTLKELHALSQAPGLTDANKVRVTGTQASAEHSLSIFETTALRHKERSHAASMVMPHNTPGSTIESLRDVRSDSTVKIVGHGGAGLPALGDNNGHLIPLSQVASDLMSGGLAPDHMSVRMTSCASADALRRTSFTSGVVPDRAFSPSIIPQFLRTPSEAPAKTLANELSKSGFHQLSVEGYQGMGVLNPQGHEPQRQLGTDVTTRRAAATVGQHFHAD